MSCSLASVHATNTTDDSPIAQTPPLDGKIQLDYMASDWHAGGRVRFASKQDRIDSLSKQGFGETAGWRVRDLYGGMELGTMFSLRAGVDNVLDQAYVEHASGSNLLDPFAIKVNEPGRTLWVKVTVEF